MAKKKGGAPAGNANARKKNPMIQVSIRGIPEELDLWLDKADQAGLSLSAWLRLAANEKARRK